MIACDDDYRVSIQAKFPFEGLSKRRECREGLIRWRDGSQRAAEPA